MFNMITDKEEVSIGVVFNMSDVSVSDKEEVTLRHCCMLCF